MVQSLLTRASSLRSWNFGYCCCSCTRYDVRKGDACSCKSDNTAVYARSCQPWLPAAVSAAEPHVAVGEGNQQDTLHFETLGGQLSVQSITSKACSLPTFHITLPKSDSSMQLPNDLKLTNASLKVSYIPTLACHAVESKCIVCLLLLFFCSLAIVQLRIMHSAKHLTCLPRKTGHI